MLRVERADGALTLTLNHPARGNALGPELVESLIDTLAGAGHDETLHTLVLRADGPHFCTGLDLSDLEHCSDGDLLARLVRIETLLATIWHAPWHTRAFASGRCWGAGADLFAVCEQRIAAPGTSFRFPGAQFGIVLGTRRLAERVGAEAARHIVIDGAEWLADAALTAGLVSRIDDSPGTLAMPRVTPATARAVRGVTRSDTRDADLAALVRSAAEPGLKARITAYRERQRAR